MAAADETIAGWDDGAEALFGYSRAEAIGQPVRLIIPPEHHDDHLDGFRRVMAGGDRTLGGVALNLPVRLRSGEIVTCRARFIYLDDAAGEPAGAVVVFSRPATGEPFARIEG